MNKLQWNIFCDFKNDFKGKIEEWNKSAPELKDLQKKAVEIAKAPLYSFETSVVYNRALDEITENDDIKLIVIGDNPGKDEQLIINNKYLVGQAGKIANGYFMKNPQLGIDFRKNVIILNKTPIHSGKTAQLKTIAKLGGEKITNLIEESQIWMSKRTAQLHCDLCEAGKNVKTVGCSGITEESKNNQLPELWLVGYSELKDKGIFVSYRNYLKSYYMEHNNSFWNKVYVFQHFSMNRFTIDLNNFIKERELGEMKNKENSSLIGNIHNLGIIHRNEIFN